MTDFNRNANFAGFERPPVSRLAPSARYTECPCSRCRYGRADSPSGQLHFDPPRRGCASSSLGHLSWGNLRGRERRGSRCGRWRNPPETSPEVKDFQTLAFRPDRNSRSLTGLLLKCRTDRSKPRVTLLCLPAECFQFETQSRSSALRAAFAALEWKLAFRPLHCVACQT